MNNVAVSRIADELGWVNTGHVASFGTAVFAGTAGFNDRLSRAHGEQRILTVGSCLRETWNQPELDWARTFTNNSIEVEACLDIEAATSVIFSELRDVVSSGGSGVADRHIALMATIMTASGTVTSLTRYGDARLGITSAVVRASFEKQNAHIIDAGIYAEDAPVRSLADCIVVGRRPPMGTGIVSLSIDPKYLRQCQEKASASLNPEAARDAKRSNGTVQALLATDPLPDRQRQREVLELLVASTARRGNVSWHAGRLPLRKLEEPHVAATGTGTHNLSLRKESMVTTTFAPWPVASPGR